MDGLNFDSSVTAVQPAFCKHGHAWTHENTIWQVRPDRASRLSRQCRECRRLTSRRHRERKITERETSLKRWKRGRAFRFEPSTKLPLINQMFVAADEMKISISELSEMTGYARQLIWRWKNGEVRPNAYALVDCFNALNYDLVPVKRGEK